jgi:hypothetical protein
VAGRVAAHRAGHDVVASAVVPTVRTSAAWASHYLSYPARLSGRRAGLLPPYDDGAHGLSFRRTLLARLGPFDADTLIGEDTIVLRELARRGIAGWFEPSVRNTHPGPASLPALVRDCARRGGHRGRWWDDRPERTGLVALAAVCAVRLERRLHWTWRKVARSSPSDLPRLARVFPWVVAGALASSVGWARAVRAGAGPAAGQTTA